MNASLLRTSFASVAFVAFALGGTWAALSACGTLDDTSPLPSPDASDLDAGQPPATDDTSSSSSSSTGGPPIDAGPLPPSGRVRLANLLQGPAAIDLCAKVDSASGSWTSSLVTQNPSEASKPDGLNFGEVSQSVFLTAAGGSGTKYVFRAVLPGSDCNDPATPVFASFASTALKQGGGLTLVAVGVFEDGVDAGDAQPRGAVLTDTIAPPANASLFRVFHGVPDVAAFDVVVNGETVLSGIKYATAFPYPYSSTTGFASIAAGVPDNAKLTFRSGTTVRTFTVPTRLRRGIATTVFVGGTKDNLDVQECADRTPDSSSPTATCTKLVEQQ